MGNNQSNTSNSRPASASPGSSSHGATTTTTARSRERGEPKIRDSLQSTRIAAPPEPSMAQARGTSVSHRSRPSQPSTPHSVRFGEGTPPGTKEPPKPQTEEQKQTQKLESKDEPSKPVAVPTTSTSHGSHTDTSNIKSPYDMSAADAMDDPMSYGGYIRPPRLPLPIEEEIHTPGSPIIAPQADIDAPIPNVEDLDHEVLPRKTSGLSNATGDEGSDDEELPIDKTKASVPFDFFWTGPAQKVYVTGSIFQWSRKAKLHPVPGDTDKFKATLYIRPGTHHVRFIVDNDMTVSNDLPTTVDFGNNLVNYIEVSADDVPKDTTSAPEISAMGTPVIDDGSKELEQPATESSKSDTAHPKPAQKLRSIDPTEKYTSSIPQYLVDLDKAEDSTAYQNAAAAIEKLPTPPTLPGFLGKPILNAATPMKDDNSVLNMPNHTVLNHLATSSIKNNVLAVSATTRYKFKYVTTIMYKPTSDDS